MRSLSLKEKQINKKNDTDIRCILQKEMQLSMKQNFLTQEANRYSIRLQNFIIYIDRNEMIIMIDIYMNLNSIVIIYITILIYYKVC
jgi:hypothetical protein